MDALLVIIGSLVAYYLAYRFYATFLAERIWQLNPQAETPAERYDDGFEYVPTRKDVVAGHHFTSIAGAAPIVGPVAAAIWGWLPGLLWVIFGTIFIGAVHDLGALVSSLRHDGRGIADYLQDLLGARATQWMYAVVFFLLVLVSAVFVDVIATLMEAFPQAVYSVWVEIPLAIIIGLMIRYRWRVNIYLAAIISVAIMYGFIALGVQYPLELSYETWVWILLGYMLVAARLPVWLLVQPRDFINGIQLIIALVVASVGILALSLAGEATMAAPAVRIAPEGAPPIWPFVMITIACGAISGWHAVVGSGTTPKQIRREPDAKMVGYGSMLGEGYLAVIALLTAVVGLGVAGYQEWYPAWQVADWPVIWPEGGATFTAALGIPVVFGAAFFAVVAKSFAMTTLDSAMRFTRLAVAESSDTFNLPDVLKDKTVSLFPGWIVIMALAVTGYGMTLWPLFGATNQILAGLALIAAAVFIKMLGRATTAYIIPFYIMIITAMVAMVHEIFNQYIPEGQWPLVIIGAIVFICGIGVLVSAYQGWKGASPEDVET